MGSDNHGSHGSKSSTSSIKYFFDFSDGNGGHIFEIEIFSGVDSVLFTLEAVDFDGAFLDSDAVTFFETFFSAFFVVELDVSVSSGSTTFVGCDFGGEDGSEL